MEFKSNVDIDGKLSVTQVATEATSMAGLFRASNGDITTRGLGSMALQGTGSYYDKTASDARFLQSIALSLPSIFNITSSNATVGNPNLTASFNSQSPNVVFAGPSSGSANIPSFRALVAGDIPAIAISGVTGLQAQLDDKINGLSSSGYIAMFTDTKTIAGSLISQVGSRIGIDRINPDSIYKLDVNGGIKATGLTVGNDPMGVGLQIFASSNFGRVFASTETLDSFAFSSFTWTYGSGFGGLVQRMKLDVTGLKLGTGSASYALDATGSIGYTGALYVHSGTFDSLGKIILNNGTDGQYLKRTTISGSDANIWSNIAIGDITNLQTTLNAKFGGTLTSGYLPVANGTYSFVDSPIYNSGNNTGIGTTSVAGYNLRMVRNFTTTTSYGMSVEGDAQTGVTTVNGYQSLIGTASGVTPTSVRGYFASQGTFVGTPTNQYGFFASNTLIGATNNYGFYSNIASGTGMWNFYANGTANNYFNGKIGIGSITLTSTNINITLPLTGASSYYGVMNSGQVQSDVSVAVAFRSNIGNASGATTADLIHFGAYRGTISGTVTRQYGFYVDSTMSTATTGVTNYGFFSALASGTNMWNIYSAGSANNYFNGNVWIGLTSSSYKFDVNGTSHFSGNATFDNRVIIATAPANATDAVNKAYVDSLTFIKNGDAVKTVAFVDITRSGTQTINGVSLVAGDLILLTGQSTPAQNGVYMVASGSWTRSTNNDSDSEIRQVYHLVTAGTYINQRYINTNASAITLNTTDITYALYFGAETDPVWGAFQTAQDITPTRIGQWNSAYTFTSALTSTNALTEGSNNKYFTEARVQASILSNYSLTGVSNTALAITDSVVGAFQKTQVQLNNRLIIGGNAFGAAIAAGTNDGFDFTLRRAGTTQISLKTTGVEFGADINIVTGKKILLAGNSGVDHQFIKYNGTGNEWATLNTGELSDKLDLVMLENIAGERGFQMFSDSAKTYADAFVYTNSVAGIALGLHGYANDESTHTIKEFGLELDVDGYLYHQKIDGNRYKIATVDMLSGGNSATWAGGNVTGDIYVPFGKSIWWDYENGGSFITMYEAGQPPISSARTMSINSNYFMTLSATQTLKIQANKIQFASGGGSQVEVDFGGANSFPDGQYLRFQKSSSGGVTKIVLVSD